MSWHRRLRILLISGAPLSACADHPMIVAEHLNPKNVQRPLQGLPYFLPKAVIPISIVGSDGSDAAGKDTQPAASSDPGSTGGAATPNGSSSSTKSASVAPTATATASPQVTVNVQPAQASSESGAGSKQAGSTYKLTVTAGKPSFVPDPSEEYYLHYTPDGWSDDTLSLHVETSGLLQSSKGTAVDQTAAVGTALVQLAAVAVGLPGSVELAPAAAAVTGVHPLEATIAPDAVASRYYDSYDNWLRDYRKAEAAHKAILPGPGLPPGYVAPKPPTPPSPPKCNLPAVNKSFNYEPGYTEKQDDGAEPPEVWRPNDETFVTPRTSVWLIAADTKWPNPDSQWVKLQIEEKMVSPEIKTISYTSDNLNTAQHDPLGILFRDWANWTITIDIEPSEQAHKVCHITKMHHQVRDLLLPNHGQKFWENMNRQPLIDKQISLTVQNGMLTGVDPTRPSTVLAWIKLPLTIIQPIISAPFQAIAGGKSATTAAPASGN